MAGALRDALASLPADDPGDAATHPAPWAAALGRLDAAVADLQAAGEAERLGMVPFTEWIRQLRARFPAAAAAGSPLSPRELEVARLVARGLTNKQIGQALYVSERTAENHVQHILTKLGLRNRSQIAAWASASEAPPAPPTRA